MMLGRIQVGLQPETLALARSPVSMHTAGPEGTKLSVGFGGMLTALSYWSVKDALVSQRLDSASPHVNKDIGCLSFLRAGAA